MMKILGALIAALLSIPLLGASANAAIVCGTNGWVCQEKIDRGSVTFTDGEYGLVTVHYKRAYKSGEYQRVKPLFVVASYDMDRSSITCDNGAGDFTGRYDDPAMKVNMNFWRPYTGETFNPPQFGIGCDTSGNNSRVQDYDNAPWLEFGPGNGDDRQPRWKAGFELALSGNTNEFRTHTQDFNPSS